MMQTLARLGKIIQLIGVNPGISPANLLRKLELCGHSVAERTLYSDIKSIRDELTLLPGGTRARDGYLLDGFLTVSADEAVQILDALEAFSIDLRDEDFALLTGKIRRRFKTVSKEPARIRRKTKRLGHSLATKKGLPQVLDAIQKAIETSQACCMVYRSPRTVNASKFTNYPLLNVFYERAWYLIVKDTQTGDYFPCRLDRIESLEPTPRLPQLRNSEECAAEVRFLISHGWGMTFPRNRTELLNLENEPDTIVRFDSSIGDYLLETVGRHPKASVERAKDGTGDILFAIKLHDSWEFKHWVRQFGSLAWFLAPKVTVDAEKRELIKLARRYELEIR